MVLRALGLPLEQIRTFLEADPSPAAMRALLDERKRSSLAESMPSAPSSPPSRHASAISKTRTAPNTTSSCATCRRRSWRACVASCRSTAPSTVYFAEEIAGALPGTARSRATAPLAPLRARAPGDRLRSLVVCAGAADQGAARHQGLSVASLPGGLRGTSQRRRRLRTRPAAPRARPCRASPFEIGGPMRERYFSSAGDARFDLTEIQFPLQPSPGRRVMTVVLSSPKTRPPPTGYSADRRGDQGQDRPDRRPGRARCRRQARRRGRLPRPGRADLQEPRCRRARRRRHLQGYREDQQLLRGERRPPRRSQPSAMCATATSISPTRRPARSSMSAAWSGQAGCSRSTRWR